MKHRSVAILVPLAMILVSLPHCARQARQLVAIAENRLWLACFDALLSIPFDDAPQQDATAVCQLQNDFHAGTVETNAIARRVLRQEVLVKSSGRIGSRNSLSSRTQAALPSYFQIAASHALNNDPVQIEATKESLQESNPIAGFTVEPNSSEIDVPMPSRIAYRLDENPITQKRRAFISLEDQFANLKAVAQTIRISNLDESIARSIAFTCADGINKKALKLRLKYTEGHKAPHRIQRSCPLPLSFDTFDEHAIANLITQSKDVTACCASETKLVLRRV